MTSRRIFTAVSNRVMSNANGLVAVSALVTATTVAGLQLWQLRFSLVDLAPLGCIYLMTRSAHLRRVTRRAYTTRNTR
jgi:hypothetical protein